MTRNREYYSNPDTVKKDLNNFSQTGIFSSNHFEDTTAKKDPGNSNQGAKFTKEYFQNPKNVYYDLLTFAKAAKLVHIKDLTTDNMAELEITCANGKIVDGTKYLSLAVLFLKLPKVKAGEAYGFQTTALKKLIAISEKLGNTQKRYKKN